MELSNLIIRSHYDNISSNVIHDTVRRLPKPHTHINLSTVEAEKQGEAGVSETDTKCK